MLTQAQLKSLIHYDPDTGLFTWIVKPCSRIRAGSQAGGYGAHGYYRVSLLGRRYFAHRVAWLYMTGKWPENQIDHINCIRDDNRFSNLREATAIENNSNILKKVVNTSGFAGVNFDVRSGRWLARARSNGKRFNLGLHDTAEKAYAARCDFAKKHHGDFFNAG